MLPVSMDLMKNRRAVGDSRQPFFLNWDADPAPALPSAQVPDRSLAEELSGFCQFGRPTQERIISFASFEQRPCQVSAWINEFWTARQRQAHSLHEISYRACFKPQLPRFFIERLSQPNEVVYDPFMGRGTTLLEAALLGRVPYGCDINPLSVFMIRPRLQPPTLEQVARRLEEIDLSADCAPPEELLVFYHPETLREINSLKLYLLARRQAGCLDALDEWIGMVALNRLTGHSPGFFSVYTLPPNQAVSVKSQRKINLDRKQVPPRRDVRQLLLKKARQLLRDCGETTRQALAQAAADAKLLTEAAASTPGIADGSVALVVTSPPFLNVVDYTTDNWLRCWFLGLEAKDVRLTVPRELGEWQKVMTAVLVELRRVLRPKGHIAFEVGEVHGGKTRLEEAVLPCGVAAGLEPVLVLINDQKFTKTANCWGVDNMGKGTNTNRIIVFRKD